MGATRIKIFIRIGNFILPIPSLKIKTIKRLTTFGLKYVKDIQISQKELNDSMNIIFQTLSGIEPFEMVYVDAIDNGKKIKVLIKTM